MIFIDNTFAPLAVVGVVPHTVRIPANLGCDESRLWANDVLLFTLVVPGGGRAAQAAHRELLRWLQTQQPLLRHRVCAFAWVIADDVLRRLVRSRLAVAREAALASAAEVFDALPAAFSWLRTAMTLSPPTNETFATVRIPIASSGRS